MSTTQVYTAKERGHWYDHAGVGVHQVPNKSKPGTFRNTTVTDARKMGLVPSATNILSVMEKPQLVAYKVNQAILSALTLPQMPNETIDDFAVRVADDSEQHAIAAAALGTLCHSKMEAALLVADMDQIDLDDVKTSSGEAAINLSSCFGILKASLARPCRPDELEFRVVHKMLGYAGTCDSVLAIRPDSPIGDMIRKAGYSVPEGTNVFNAFADLKTRGCKTKRVPTYEADSMQLSAYSAARIMGCNGPSDFDHVANLFPHISIIVNTNASTSTSQNPEVVAPPYGIEIWEPEKLKASFIAFLHAFGLWKFLKNYNPSATPTP